MIRKLLHRYLGIHHYKMIKFRFLNPMCMEWLDECKICGKFKVITGQL